MRKRCAGIGTSIMDRMPQGLAAALSFGLFCLTSPDFSPAATVTLSGALFEDDEVVVVPFTITAASDAVFRTRSYAEGPDSDPGVLWGGFDPVLSLFNGSGNLLFFADDGTEPDVSADPVSGLSLDSFFVWSVTPGDYYLAVSQSNNYPGLTLADPFLRQGEGNFTSEYGCGPGRFFDYACNARNSGYFVEIGNVTGVFPEPPPPPPPGCDGEEICEPAPVPVPPASYLFGAGLLGIWRWGVRARKRKDRPVEARHTGRSSESAIALRVATAMFMVPALACSRPSVAETLPTYEVYDDLECRYHFPTIEAAKAAPIWRASHDAGDGYWNSAVPRQESVPYHDAWTFVSSWVDSLPERWNSTDWVLDQCTTALNFESCEPVTQKYRVKCFKQGVTVEGRAYSCASAKESQCNGHFRLTPNIVGGTFAHGEIYPGTNQVRRGRVPGPPSPTYSLIWNDVFIGEEVKCPVGPLTPLEDYIRQYHANEPDMAEVTRTLENLAPASAFAGPLSARMNAALACLEGKTNPAPGVSCTTTRESGFRPEAYQAHFLDVVSKWKELQKLKIRDPVKYDVCMAIGRVKEIDDHKRGKHQLSDVAAPVGGSNHGKRPAEAVDLRFNCTRTNSNGAPSAVGAMDPLFDAMASQCGVSRIKRPELRMFDPWHFN